MTKPSLEIRKVNKQVWLFIDGTRHDTYFMHNQRVRFFQHAIAAFDKDIEDTATKFKSYRFGAFLWLFTPQFYRGEEITGLIRWLYIFEMIKFLHDRYSAKSIVLSAGVPYNVKIFLKNQGIRFYFKHFANVGFLFRDFLRTLFNLYSFMLRNIRLIFKRSNSFHEGVIADINRSFTAHRYDSIENVIRKYPKIKFFSGQEHPLYNVDLNDQVIFRNELTFLTFLKSLIESINLELFFLKNKSHIPYNLFYSYSGFINFLNWYDLIIFRKCVEKYLDKCKIEKIIHVSTLTKPTYRILMAEARKRGIKFTLVASRTLMSLRSSERLLKCDVDEYNETSLPDSIVVKDQYSMNVFANHPRVAAKIKIGSRFKSDRDSKISTSDQYAILILFNHRHDLVHSLLNEISKTGINKLVKTIIYRCHPSYVLKNGEMAGYFPANFIIDITSKDYSVLNDYQTITISGPTTGALDALQSGSTLILWVPYIYDDGILMDDIMNCIGIKCENLESLKSNSHAYVQNLDLLKIQMHKDIETLHSHFRTEMLISEVLD